MTDLVRVLYTGGPSGDWLTQFHLDRLLGGTAQDSVDTVHGFYTAFQSVMSSVVTAAISGSVEILDPITGKPTGVDTASGYSVHGGDYGEPLPFQTQGLIAWNTGVWIGGRQVRGKTYIPGPGEAANAIKGRVRK